MTPWMLDERAKRLYHLRIEPRLDGTWRSPFIHQATDRSFTVRLEPLYELVVGERPWHHLIEASTLTDEGAVHLTSDTWQARLGASTHIARLPLVALLDAEGAAAQAYAELDQRKGLQMPSEELLRAATAKVEGERGDRTEPPNAELRACFERWDGRPEAYGLRLKALPRAIALSMGQRRSIAGRGLDWSFIDQNGAAARFDVLDVYDGGDCVYSVGRYGRTALPSGLPSIADHGAAMALIGQLATRADDPFGVLNLDGELPVTNVRSGDLPLLLTRAGGALATIDELLEAIEEEQDKAPTWLENFERYRLRDHFLRLRRVTTVAGETPEGSIRRVQSATKEAERLEAQAFDTAVTARTAADKLRTASAGNPARVSATEVAARLEASAARVEVVETRLDDVIQRLGAELTRYELTRSLQDERDAVTRNVTVVGGIIAVILAGLGVAAAVAAVPSLQQAALAPSQALVIRAGTATALAVMVSAAFAVAISALASRAVKQGMNQRHALEINLAAGCLMVLGGFSLLHLAVDPAGRTFGLGPLPTLAVTLIALTSAAAAIAARWDPKGRA